MFLTIVVIYNSEFKGLAKGTLNDCYIQDPEKGCAIVRETAVGFSVSPIQAAIWYNIRPFVDEPASSDYLDSVWTGRVIMTKHTRTPT